MSFSRSKDDVLFFLAYGDEQVVVPTALRARVLNLCHYAMPSEHPGGKRRYYFLRRSFYWPFMSVDFYASIKSCVTCAKNRVALRLHNKPLKSFPALAPLEFVAINILGELFTAPGKNKCLLVITDRFSKLV